MQHQSFPGVKGSSESLEKIKALYLPSLTLPGRTRLD